MHEAFCAFSGSLSSCSFLNYSIWYIVRPVRRLKKKKSKRTQQRVPPTSKAEQQQADIKIISIEKSSTE
jgi:hypothetical protein